MKKYILILAVLFMGVSVYAQDKNITVKHEQKNDLVESTYFYADGTVQQKGTFNKEGKLHGTWTSFDANGNKIAVGNYENGKKVGKWTFWANGVAKEVNYVNSKIAKITEVSSNNSL
ncbi:nicotinic acid mononucleotide adenyltransferase [Seonamhaeicola algicola]|uniref:Nicotinic acid mononucleotide adenyltransferase n=1 Tax=Seonamhaeicola algicola TaxID=1719036 RepID=A0A5C7B4D7_9FLAO|nr:nicotinic acid mononucleotide adenyltransferase [Seonamhaeicola algicola]TXE12742.1 nicotinic acid mononucleotide adenyltransferase [Seonamhaeicola algicola]